MLANIASTTALFNRRASYEIPVARRPGPTLAAHFPAFSLADEDDTTVSRGADLDQAALHSVLARIRDLGLTLVACVRIADTRRSA